MDHRNFYGRIKGKALNAAQDRYLEEDLPGLSVAGITREENPERAALDMQELAGDRPLWLEIGFGGGEHLVHQALQNPDVQFLGVEPYVNGVAMLLGKMRKAGVNNIKLHMGDARNLMDVLPLGRVKQKQLNCFPIRISQCVSRFLMN